MMLDAFDRMMESASRQIAQRSIAPQRAGAARHRADRRRAPADPAGRPLGADEARARQRVRQDRPDHAIPTACNYWRHCSSDGYLCECCGGTYNQCPPGSIASPTSWVGTCVNPDDNQAYLIAYQDCCGKDSCGQCACLGTEGEMPSYRPELNNDIIWCFGAPSMVYHCSSQVVIGKA